MIIAAYEQNGLPEKSPRLFVLVLACGWNPQQCSDTKTNLQSIAWKSIAELSNLEWPFTLFVGSILVDMCCKYWVIDEAVKLHDRLDSLEQQNIVSWNAITPGCLAQNQNEEALWIFSLMLEMVVEPDNYTHATVPDFLIHVLTWHFLDLGSRSVLKLSSRFAIHFVCSKFKHCFKFPCWIIF